MFAGIVEDVGNVRALKPAGAGPQQAARLTLQARPGFFNEIALGASVAVNGVCLTMTSCQADQAEFDVVPETLRRSNLQTLQPGARVNLERSLRVGDRIDGHFVQGHVDGVGRVHEVDTSGGEWRLWVAAESRLAPYLASKGSIALDGVSLTLAEILPERFAVALVPTTLERTALRERRVGDPINIETDILARMFVRRMELREDGPHHDSGVTWDLLTRTGMMS